MCLKRKTWTEGIFCANFYWTLNGFPPCHRAWCGRCYTSSEAVKFHVRSLKVVEDTKELGRDKRDEVRIEKSWGRKKAKTKRDFLEGRDGDHLLVPFECDLCVFRKLRKTDPSPSSQSDILLMAVIRRANLDAFWSRTSDTVKANRRNVVKGLKLSSLMRLGGPYKQFQPFPNYDHCGYEVAAQMLLASRNPGRNAEDHLQFDSIRSLLTAYGNYSRASPQSSSLTLALSDQKGRYQRFATDATGSLWFKRFFQGCRYRMGQEWKPNKAFSTPLLLALLQTLENRIQEAEDDLELNRWIVMHSFAVVTYVLSLRGPEGFLVDLEGLNTFWNDRDEKKLVITL